MIIIGYILALIVIIFIALAHERYLYLRERTEQVQKMRLKLLNTNFSAYRLLPSPEEMLYAKESVQEIIDKAIAVAKEDGSDLLV